ncbi:MAG: hypothetical protein ACR2O3_09010 [Rhizobiaceae bacterium]
MKTSNSDRDMKGTSSILLLGNYRPTLVIARSLKSQGYRVISGLEGCDRGAEYSRCVDEIWDHKPVEGNEAGFILELQEFLSGRSDIAFVLPVTENFVRLFAETTPQLPEHVKVVMNDPGVVNACLNKTGMLQLARSCKVPVTPYETVSDFAGLSSALKVIGFPVVVRPADSTLRLFDKKAVTLEGLSCLQQWFSEWPEEHAELLVQAKAPGIRHNIYFAAVDGKILKYLHSRIDRTDRLDGSGLAVDGITVVPDPVLHAYTSNLVAGLNYTGIGCAQYLVDEYTRQSVFLEINSRFAGNHAVPEFCGLGLTEFMMQLATEARFTQTELEYGRSKVRYSWIAGDLEGLKLAVRKREIGFIKAFEWLGRSIATGAGSELDMMFNRQDLKPALVSFFKVLPGARHVLNWRFTSFPNKRISPNKTPRVGADVYKSS